MESQFNDLSVPDRSNNYYCSLDTKSKKFTHLMKLVLMNIPSSVQMIESLLKDNAEINNRNSKGWTALMIASANTRTFSSDKIVKMLIDAGADVNLETEDNLTALIVACINYNDSTIKILIDAGADINCKDINGWSLLMLAIVYFDDAEIIKMLIDAGADVNHEDEFGKTALIMACEKSDDTIVKMLIDAKADPNIGCKFSSSALKIACKNFGKCDKLGIIKMLLEAGAKFNSLFDGLIYMITETLASINVEMLEMLIDYGLNINLRDKKSGLSALSEAVSAGKIEYVEFLIKKGVNLNNQDNTGKTVLMIACEQFVDDTDIKIVKLLIDAGAYLNIRDMYENTVLSFLCGKAETKDSIKIIELLINAKADLNIQNKGGNTALIKAVYYPNNNKTIEMLINGGANLDIQNDLGYSALMFLIKSSWNYDPAIIELFINGGANVNLTEKNGSTVLFFATNVDIVKLLLDAGADPNIINSKKKTAFIKLIKRQVPDEELMIRLILLCRKTLSHVDDYGKSAYDYYVKNYETDYIDEYHLGLLKGDYAYNNTKSAQH